MIRAISASLIIALAAATWGCRDTTPPPRRVPVPETDERAYRERDIAKPLPPPREPYDPAAAVVAPFEDPPLLAQRPPEQRAFVDAYTRVGRPRITMFVNRTLEGSIIPVNPNDPLVSVEHARRSKSDTRTRESRETVDVYLRPGQYDEVEAKEIDYQAIESIFASWISANGQVTMISPTLSRQRLSDQTVKEMQEGRPQVLAEVAEQLGADVLIQVQARPTRQTPAGLEVRIIAEAMNTRGGQSIGRAVVDVPPPLDKPQINEYTRFLARKLMDDMTDTWAAMPASEPARAPATLPSN